MNANESVAFVSWLSTWGPSVLLAISAFLVAYFGVHIRHWYLRPKLDFRFEFKRPFFRLIPTRRGLFYYVTFAVTNNGRTQANDCEAVLEKIWRKAESAENSCEWCKWRILPVNLKWSGENSTKDFKAACFKTVYPGGREVFCDIGYIMAGSDKFCFELPRQFLGQSDALMSGKYKIQISIYAKNARKITRTFKISWSGKWEDKEEKMSREIVVS